jgi:peroxiredoxin
MPLWNKLARKLGMEGALTNIDAGKRAPDFTLKSLEGENVSLDSLLKRGPAMVAFFKISCPVCQFTFPFLQRIWARFAGTNVSVIGISQDDAEKTKKFNKEFGVTFTTLIDSAGYPTSNAYGLTNVPTIFLIASDAIVKVSCMGFDKAGLESIVAELSQEQKIAATPLFRAGENVPAHRPG